MPERMQVNPYPKLGRSRYSSIGFTKKSHYFQYLYTSRGRSYTPHISSEVDELKTFSPGTSSWKIDKSNEASTEAVTSTYFVANQEIKTAILNKTPYRIATFVKAL